MNLEELMAWLGLAAWLVAMCYRGWGSSWAVAPRGLVGRVRPRERSTAPAGGEPTADRPLLLGGPTAPEP